MNLLVVEDDPTVRAGLVGAMRRLPGASVLGCGTLKEAFAALARAAPLDVALVDVGLPDGSGLQVIRRVRVEHPSALVLVVSVFDDDETIVAALRAGASGYLLKDATPEALVAGVEQALAGGVVMSPYVTQRVATAFWPTDPPASAVRIGPRERELLGHLQAGATYEQAALAMGIQLGTVQGYIKRLYRKVGVSTKVEVLRAAVRLGWLPP